MQTIMYSCFKVYNELCWIFFCIIRRTVINEFLVYFKAYNSNSSFLVPWFMMIMKIQWAQREIEIVNFRVWVSNADDYVFLFQGVQRVVLDFFLYYKAYSY